MNGEFIRNRYSKKHHYLPVFYLKGFVNSFGCFYVYDKLQDKILPPQKPDSKYYENHLNNYKFDGEIKFTLEESFFSHFDTEIAPLFAKIRDSEFADDEINNLQKFQIIHFIMQLYWRLPHTNRDFSSLIVKEGFTTKLLSVYDGERELSDQDLPEMMKSLIEDEQSQRLFKSLMSLSPGAMTELYSLFDKWNTYNITSGDTPLIIGDHPIVLNNPNPSFDKVFGDFVFPISKNRLLLMCDDVPKFLESALVTHINLCVLHQSRYISCHNEKYLFKIIEQYKKLKEIRLDNAIIKMTFDLINRQSKFENFTDFLNDYNKK